MKWDDQMGRRLRLKDLHTVQTVAAARSMAKASERLGLSQPAISKAISDLEQTLGARLFDRSSTGVELTKCGRMLVARTRVIFDEVRQCGRDIEHLTDPTRGEVRIGTIEPLAGIVSEIISRLVRRYPRVSYHVTVSDGDTLERELRERTLDVLIARWVPPVVAEDLTAEVLFKSPLAVMAERHHPLLRRKRLSLGDLMEERWALSPPESFLGRIVSDLFRRRKLPLPSAVVTTISVYMRLNLMATGAFLTVLPLTMLRHRPNRPWLRALEVDLRDSASPIAAITLKGRQGGGAVLLFRQASLEVCKEITESP
jgi:DNA-binding transcriptional LysR family regulator